MLITLGMQFRNAYLFHIFIKKGERLLDYCLTFSDIQLKVTHLVFSFFTYFSLLNCHPNSVS